MKSQQQHDLDVSKIRHQVADQFQSKAIPLALDSHTSNILRSFDYKKKAKTLGLNILNQVITINPENQTVLVEPRMTMEELHREVFKQGYIIPVLPEFKGITVGGAINGAAIESSSFRDGQFNDICMGYEILIGDGTVIWASPTHHADLFYAIPGSYGSLGIVVAVEIKLLPASEWVRLRYHPVNSVRQAIELIRNLKKGYQAPDYLEGIIYSPTKALVIEGSRVTAPNKDDKKISLGNPWNPWFYQHAEKYLEKSGEEVISMTDYLFRHDRGAFWMGAYATHLPLFWRYLFEGILKWKWQFPNWRSQENISRFMKIKNPGFFFRSLLGWAMPSQTLYKLLHAGSEHWFENKFVIQDFYIPEKHAETFLNDTMDQEGIFPIWLCPVRATTQPQLFSPHYQETLSGAPAEDIIDIGLYGLPKGTKTIAEVTRRLEQETSKLGGRKMLYSHSYFTPDEFWKIYPEEEYRFLRQRYHADGMWLNLDEKVLN